jgi:hypothetical protein
LLGVQFGRAVGGMKRYRQTTLLCFVEREKAFDRVMLDDVLNVLEKKNLRRNLINIIKEMYPENETLIKTESSTSR